VARYRIVFKVDDLGSTRVCISHADYDEQTAIARAAMQLREFHPDSVTVLEVGEF
jgi:hypothetical protein